MNFPIPSICRSRTLFRNSCAGVTALALLALPAHATPSTDTKIGQMIMVGFNGTTPDDKGVQAVTRQLSNGSIGGVMLLKHNIVSRQQLLQLTSTLKQAATSGGQLPPFIAVDQEGGAVQRLTFTRYPSASHIALRLPAEAGKVYDKLACELRASGINVNFGPVADLDLRGQANPVVGRSARSYGNSPEIVTKFARQFVASHKRYGVMTVAKHFPGHGSSLSDSHKDFTPIPEWNQLGNELAPFATLAQGNPDQSVDMIMIGHLYNKAWNAPATLSYKAVTGLLRQKIKFNGVAITDDMEMGAISKNFGWKTALVKAINAGNDVVLYANTVTQSDSLGLKIADTIAKSVCTSTRTTNCISPKRIEQAYNRIANLKRRQKQPTSICQ